MDDDRNAILARRARFLTAAVAGAGISAAAQSCAAEQKPAVCLEPPVTAEIIVPEADAAPEETADGDLPGRSSGPEATPPKPPQPYPRICLSEY